MSSLVQPASWRQVLVEAARPPVRDRRFWLIQLLILAVVVGHLVLDLWAEPLPLGIPDFVSAGLFLVPIVYAALNFGLSGACASAAWGTLLMAPDLLVVDSPGDLWADATVLAIIDVVAAVVGQRVERQLLAQRRTVAALEAHRQAEARYRALFDRSSAPTLVVDRDGLLVEANPAAAALFGRRARRARLAELVGETAARRLLDGSALELLRVPTGSHRHRDLRPMAARIPGTAGDDLLLVLQDVTHEHEQQRRTEAYATLLLRLQEEERQRVAHEIHDEPLQTLLYLLSRLWVMATGPNADPAVADEAAAAHAVLSAVVDNLSGIMGGLRPPVLDDLGLVPALRSIVAKIGETSEVDARLHVRGRPRAVPPDVENALFRTAQECLRNVERHASARQVNVRLTFGRGRVELAVEDDGRGFDPRDKRAGSGLLAIENRASLLGGAAHVSSEAGRGTAVWISIPTRRRRLSPGSEPRVAVLGR